MSRFQFFWETMKKCDWSTESDGNSKKVLKPVVDYLASLDDKQIFQFGTQMTQLLYDLDTRKNFEEYVKVDGYASDDGFLYARCVGLINGENYYECVKWGKITDIWSMEYEALLYVTGNAWGQKHNKDSGECPNYSQLSYETGSNQAMWHDKSDKVLVYDKVDWHLDGGEDYDEVVKRLTSVFEFLREHDLLNDVGLKEFENGVDDSTILCDEQLTETGNEFIKKYLDLTEQLAEHLGDMKSALNMLFIRFKGEQI